MGYELERFVEKIDEELQCSICTLVLENPIKTRCENSFCNTCIYTWLLVNPFCPVDGQPLQTADLMHPSRMLRNLLIKLRIKCDFRKYIEIWNCSENVSLIDITNFLRWFWMPGYRHFGSITKLPAPMRLRSECHSHLWQGM